MMGNARNVKGPGLEVRFAELRAVAVWHRNPFRVWSCRMPKNVFCIIILSGNSYFEAIVSLFSVLFVLILLDGDEGQVKIMHRENIAIGEWDPSEPMNWQGTDKPSLPVILVYSTVRCQQLQNPYHIILGCKEVSRRRSIGTSVPTTRISLWRWSSFHSATRLVPQHLGHVCL